MDPSFLGVVAIGLFHGLEPGHGWPIALLYSVRKNRPLFYGFLSSSIISIFHFASSIAVVFVYMVFSSFVDVSTSLLRYVAAAILIVLAYKFFSEKVEDEYEDQHGHLHDDPGEVEHEHEHEHLELGRHIHRHRHARRAMLSLWGIATFAFFLGFAHEEEFAILAFAVGGIDPLILMVAYATSVTIALVGVTLVSLKAYELLQSKIRRYEKNIPKISALILLVMAIAFIFGLV